MEMLPPWQQIFIALRLRCELINALVTFLRFAITPPHHSSAMEKYNGAYLHLTHCKRIKSKHFRTIYENSHQYRCLDSKNYWFNSIKSYLQAVVKYLGIIYVFQPATCKNTKIQSPSNPVFVFMMIISSRVIGGSVKKLN